MSDAAQSFEGVVKRRVPEIGLGLSAASLVAALSALVWCSGLNQHLHDTQKDLALAEQKNVVLSQQQATLSAQLHASTETLGRSVGLTQRQVDVKTAGLLAAQADTLKAQTKQAEHTARLERQQAVAVKQMGAVATAISAVKTDVGGAKASIAATQVDLASTKEQLQRTIGDAGIMSGLIARNHDELDQLRLRGERVYYEFTLQKGSKPTSLSSISLQAKKVDDKHSKYTLLVNADDHSIEKKDKSIDEPLQFYTGKTPALYEIVVNNISKNRISGYLSTPKNTLSSQRTLPSQLNTATN